MLAVVELSVNFDWITVFCVLSKIWRNRTASNWRVASAIFCSSVSCELVARLSAGMSAAWICRWMEVMSISADDQFSLQCAGLFHCLEDGHDIARRDPKRVEGRGDFFHCRQFGQGNNGRLGLGDIGG